MDVRVMVALWAKAQLVFQQPETLLSFLFPPVGLSVGEMKVIAGDLSAEHKSAPFEFSRMVNSLPTVPVWTSGSDTRMLWSLCEDILDGEGPPPRVGRSSADDSAFRDAERVLFDVDDQGIRLPSAQRKLYQQYRDAWFTFQQAYRTRKLSAEVEGVDDTTRAAWIRDEPALRADIEVIERDWRERGFRQEIDVAEAALSTLAAKDPSLTWERWGSNLRFFLDSQTDVPSQSRFCPTTFSPSDVVDSSTWIDFEISTSEFEQLVGGAPPDVTNKLGTAWAAGPPTHVKVAYTTVGVIRPWLDPSMFKAQFWRFEEPGRQLSDGGSPPRGEWPMYVAGLVLARRVVAVSQPRPQPVVRDHRREREPIPAAAVSQPAVRDHRAGRGESSAVGRAEQLRPQIVAREHTVNLASSAGPTEGAPIQTFLRRLPVTASATLASPSARVLAALRRAQVTRLAQPASAGIMMPQLTTKPQPAAEPQKTQTEDEILVVAFICKPLPKCPNPDTKFFAS